MNHGKLFARLASAFVCAGVAFLAMLSFCGSAYSAQATPLTVSVMPSYAQNPSQGNAALNEKIQIWGRVYGGSGTYATYTIDFGDGSAVVTGQIDNTQVLPQAVAQDGSLAIPAYIGTGHAYATGGNKIVTLTVTDSLGATAFQSATIRVRLTPTHADRINIAVENGLRYLYLAQTPNGSSRCYWTEQSSQYGWASAGLALMAMEENGHLAGNDFALDVYAETVQRGINNLVAAGVSQVIKPQNGQVTDTNGNSRGIRIGSGNVYDHCLTTLAIIGAYPNKAAAQAATIPYSSIGVLGTAFPGVTSFYDFAVDAMDTLLWCQSDTGIGGWHYAVTVADNGGADGSTHQWPNMVLVAAKDRWGLVPPAWAVTNSMNAYVALQDHTGDAASNNAFGGCGYNSPHFWRNNGKTGGMLAAFPLGGKMVGTDTDATIAYDFIGRTWLTPPADGDSVDINSGWPGNWYYMYALKKGLQLQNVATVQVQYDDDNRGPRDWYADLSAWLIGDAALLDAPVINNPNHVQISPTLRDTGSMFGQFPDGHWDGHAWPRASSYPAIQTGGAILTLSESITVAVPVAVIAPVPDQSARKPAPFQLDGSASYDLDPSNSIVEWLWKFDAGSNPDWTHPDATGQKPSVNPGWNTESVHTVSLRVKDNQNPVQYGTTTGRIKVTINDHPPVAVPLPPSQVPQVYAGKIGATIPLDGTASYDVDGDPIISYAWDLNGDGTFGDAADAALDTSGLSAHGSTASIVFGTPRVGVVGLRVGSKATGAGPLYSTNQAAIDIYAAASDVSVQALSVSKVVPDLSTDVHAVFKNDPASAGDLSDVLVRFYNGDPYDAGAQIGANYRVKLPLGGTAILDAHLPLKAGQRFVYVKVDATDVIPEWNEQNNVAGISIYSSGNQPPVARAKNIVVTADTSGTANASIDNGSYDPDGDTIVLKQIPVGPYPIGVTSVTLVVTDSQGASSQAKATVTVLDRAAPALTLPANILVNTDPGQSTAVVAYNVTGKDSTAGFKVTTDIPSGTAFPIGTTVVTATARDSFGNAVSGTFTVTVKDGEAPAITAYDLTVAATGDEGAVVNYPAATVIDNVGLASVAYSQASGTAFPLGVTTVTVTAKDAAGNVGTGAFTVRVVTVSEPRAVQPTVPRLVGLTYAQAQAAITKAKLWVGVTSSAASATVPAGKIISQSPVADKSVPFDSIVSLVVSLGPPVKVPKVTGLSEPKAQALLAAARLRAGSVAKVNSTTVPVGSVVTQFPAAGTSVAAGSAVDLTESFGPTPAAVPNVIGLAQAQAEKLITGAGLVVGLVTKSTSSTVPAGIVISETPGGGSVAAVGSAVQITVSLGAAVTVPDVVGLPQSEAQTALLGSSLTVGAITKANSEAVAAGSVISQGPMAGAAVLQDTPINLVISLGAPKVRVPNVVGFTEATAQTSILIAKLTVGAEVTASSSTVPVGKVISQSPLAGTTAPQGSGVTLTISGGPTQTGVPSVVGLPKARAETLLTAAKLTLGTVSTANSLTVAAGNVLSQNPPAGSVTATGTAVALTISLGPTPITVPDVVGKTQPQAQSTLVESKLTFGTITTISSSTVAAGTVISQAPMAGTTAPQGSAVDLTVSLGPPIAVPSVVGLPQSQAATTIAAAKLAVGSATTATSTTIPVGSVISQAPAASTMVAQGSAVNLVISVGPPLATVPKVVGLPQPQAQSDLVAAALSLGPLTSATSATVPVGNVISQSPSAGTTVAQGSPVTLVVSLGPPVKVPNVVGLVQAQAQTNITAANLGVGTVTSAHSTTVASGKIISQVPSAGSTAAKGSDVNLVVSSGATIATVPNVVGLTKADAGTAIVSAGFTMGTVTPGISATIPAGQVFGQSPTPGSVVAAPSPVDITVSVGPGNTVVPDLAGLTQPQAVSALFPAQLRLGTVTLNPSPTVPAGQISAQSPAAGAAASPGATVDVTLSVGTLVPSDTVAPVVTIQSPVSNSTVTNLTDVVATVTDANLAFYQVDVARADKVDLANIAADNSSFTVIGQGTANVNNAKVATFDPTNLANDTYVIRVRATDRNGHIYAIYTLVNVSGNAKLGRFALDFTDLSVPLVGIPIQVVRHYDSFSSETSGDFGYGWSLGLRDAQIRALLQPSFAGPTLAPNSRLYLTTPDGRRVGFTANFQVLSQFIGTIVQVNFKPDPGVYEKVEILDGNQTYLSSGVFLGGLLGSEVYVPKKYRLTLKDGTQYDYDTTAGLQKITDLSGNTVSFTNNVISHSSGQSISIKRDAQNRITSITDPAGKSVTYGYSAQGDLVSFTDRTGVQTRFTYKPVPAHYLDSVIDPLGHTGVRTIYDENGRITGVYDALGNFHGQTFDPAAFTGTRTDGRGNVTLLAYDARGNLLQETKPEGGVTRYEYNDPANPDKETKKTDPLGNVTTYSYDASGNKLTETDALGAVAIYTYNSQQKLRGLQRKDKVGTLLSSESATYDAAGHVVSLTNKEGNSRAFTYDASGRLLTSSDFTGNLTTYDQAHGCPCGRPSSITYADGSTKFLEHNSLNLPSKETDETGAVTRFTYDAMGHQTGIIDHDGKATTFEFDAAGNQTKRVDRLGRVTRYVYDAKDRLVKEIKVLTDDGNDANDVIINYEYDADDHLTALIDPVGNRTEFAFDKDGRLRTRTDAAGAMTTVSYDLSGNTADVIDRRGLKRSFQYDARNQPIAERWHDAAGNIIRTISIAYDALGRRTSIGDPDSAYAFQYDADSRLSQVSNAGSPNMPVVVLNYGYDKDGHTTSVTDNAGVSVQTTFDVRGLSDHLVWSGGGISPASVNLDRNGRGQVTGIKRYADASLSSLVSQTAYPNIAPQGWVREIQHKNGLGQLYNTGSKFTYGYDAEGEVLSQSSQGNSTLYKYDPVGQLLSAMHTSPGFPDEAYTYDQAGNRTSDHLHGNNFIVQPGNRLKSDGKFAYGYDAEGNLVTKTEIVGGIATGKVAQFAYDHRGRLTSIVERPSVGGPSTGVIQQTYDSFDRRISVLAPQYSLRFVYDGDNAWADYSSGGVAVSRYLFDGQPDGNLAKWSARSGTQWYLNDIINSTRGIVNALGALSAHMNYDSYGSILDGLSLFTSGDERFGFTGREFVQADTYGYRSRFYGSDTGRFYLEDDPLLTDDPANLYSYVGNQPIALRDPFGNMAVDEGLLDVNNSVKIIKPAMKTGECLRAIFDVVKIVTLAVNIYIHPGQAMEEILNPNLAEMIEKLKDSIPDVEGCVARRPARRPGWRPRPEPGPPPKLPPGYQGFRRRY